MEDFGGFNDIFSLSVEYLSLAEIAEKTHLEEKEVLKRLSEQGIKGKNLGEDETVYAANSRFRQAFPELEGGKKETIKSPKDTEPEKKAEPLEERILIEDETKETHTKKVELIMGGHKIHKIDCFYDVSPLVADERFAEILENQDYISREGSKWFVEEEMMHEFKELYSSFKRPRQKKQKQKKAKSKPAKILPIAKGNSMAEEKGIPQNLKIFMAQYNIKVKNGAYNVTEFVNSQDSGFEETVTSLPYVDFEDGEIIVEKDKVKSLFSFFQHYNRLNSKHNKKTSQNHSELRDSLVQRVISVLGNGKFEGEGAVKEITRTTGVHRNYIERMTNVLIEEALPLIHVNKEQVSYERARGLIAELQSSELEREKGDIDSRIEEIFRKKTPEGLERERRRLYNATEARLDKLGRVALGNLEKIEREGEVKMTKGLLFAIIELSRVDYSYI